MASWVPVPWKHGDPSAAPQGHLPTDQLCSSFSVWPKLPLGSGSHSVCTGLPVVTRLRPLSEFAPSSWSFSILKDLLKCSLLWASAQARSRKLGLFPRPQSLCAPPSSSPSGRWQPEQHLLCSLEQPGHFSLGQLYSCSECNKPQVHRARSSSPETPPPGPISGT
ncbi:hypothetical protein P7K49_009448 [Saguinus oedipus]|uniref:Uncharacterized protein n=1 Tax=Saguinus oedipus TaxID=9490 RepID=A0ABQ9VN53_SAGOE|nr:hypothetical protein P7K49_009448 [Saguinus oedipus]